MKSMKLLAVAALFSALSLQMTLPGFAQVKIKAVVNNEPITSNEVMQRARFLHLVSREAPNALLETNALEELIDEKLRAAEGKRHNIVVSDAQVDGAFAALGSRVHLTPEQLKQALSQSGVDVSTLRTRIRGQLLWQQLVMQRFRQTVNVSDQDIVQALQKQESKDGKTPQDQQTSEYAIQMVIFVVPASAGKGGMEARMKEAEQLRSKFSGCANLAAEAHAYKETVVKNLGKRTQDELPANFVPLLTDVPAGKMTKPTAAPEGVEMLAVCEKNEVAGNLVERSKVEDSLRQQQGEVMARQYTQELRRFAVIEYK
jgi:peptidyl-prolyl cis-trans isomerase SurA